MSEVRGITEVGVKIQLFLARISERMKILFIEIRKSDRDTILREKVMCSSLDNLSLR